MYPNVCNTGEQRSYYSDLNVDCTQIMYYICDEAQYPAADIQVNSRIRLHHFIVSFIHWECADPGVLYCIGMEISRRIGQKYQIAPAPCVQCGQPYRRTQIPRRKKGVCGAVPFDQRVSDQEADPGGLSGGGWGGAGN